MELILIKPESAEWEYIWNWLAAHPINEGLDDPSVALNPLNDEIWKYQGSFRGADGTAVHELLHRSHPKDNEFIELKVKNSDTFCDADKINLVVWKYSPTFVF
jgi:hypothetical protein